MKVDFFKASVISRNDFNQELTYVKREIEILSLVNNK
jgi:hypothetical protein